MAVLNGCECLHSFKSRLATAAVLAAGDISATVTYFVENEEIEISTDLFYSGSPSVYDDMYSMAEQLQNNVTSVFLKSVYFQAYSAFRISNLTMKSRVLPGAPIVPGSPTSAPGSATSVSNTSSISSEVRLNPPCEVEGAIFVVQQIVSDICLQCATALCGSTPSVQACNCTCSRMLDFNSSQGQSRTNVTRSACSGDQR